MSWYLAESQPDEAFRIASALVPFWMATKRIDDGDDWFRRALDEPARTDGPPRQGRLRPRLPGVLGGPVRAGRAAVREARRLAERIGDRNVVALSLAGSARVALNEDPARAVDSSGRRWT